MIVNTTVPVKSLQSVNGTHISDSMFPEVRENSHVQDTQHEWGSIWVYFLLFNTVSRRVIIKLVNLFILTLKEVPDRCCIEFGQTSVSH